MRLVSLLLAGASIVFAMLLITDLGVFLDPPSAAIVLGITVFGSRVIVGASPIIGSTKS